MCKRLTAEELWGSGRFSHVGANMQEINVTLQSDKKNVETAKKAMKSLEKYYTNKENTNTQNKEYATVQLLDLANEWQEDENGDYPDEITREEFIDRIELYRIMIESSGCTKFCYDADGMFTDHAIAVTVLANGKYKGATIE